MLRPAPAPTSWRSTRVADGAELFYPGDWTPTQGDPGTATSVLTDGTGRIRGYLNLTPRQSTETLADWSRFRTEHNVAEGERDVVLEEARGAVRFRTGAGSCVRDSYTTRTGTRYMEIACLVQGAKASSVIVAAAQASSWPALAPELERAASALIT